MPLFKKGFNKKVVGVGLNAKEREALEREIRKTMAEYVSKNAMEIDAMILWILHEELGFGPKRLRRFHDIFVPSINDLVKRYDMENSDIPWLCTRKLKEYGIDIKEWSEEEEGEL
jgi:hypothetical protein